MALVQVSVDPIKYLSSLPFYNGSRDELHTFVELIDRIFPLLAKYNDLSQNIFFDIIKSRLTGKARESVEIHNNLHSWDELKKLLYNNFSDKLSVDQLYDQIKLLQFKTSCLDFFNELNVMLRRLNNKIKISDIENKDNEIKKNCDMVLRLFLSRLPEPMKGILHCRTPKDIETAMQILHETGYAHIQNKNKNKYDTQEEKYENNKRVKYNNYKNKSFNNPFNNNSNNSQNKQFNNNFNNPFNHGNRSSNNHFNNQNASSSNSFRRNQNNAEPMEVDNSTINKKIYKIEKQRDRGGKFSVNSLGSSSELPYIIIDTPIRKLRFIIDTGATSSIVNPGICNPKWQIPIKKPIEIKTIDNMIKISKINRIPLFKEFNRIGETAEFIEYDFHSEFDGLIGNNILKPLNCILNYKDRKLEMEKAQIKIFFQKSEEDYEEFINYYKEEIYLNYNNNISDQVRLQHLNVEEKSAISSLIKEFKNVFYQENTDLTFTHAIKHTIKTSNDLPIYSKTYRYPEIHKEEVNTQINDMLRQGIIRQSNSPYSAPIWIVPKKMDASNKAKWRMVVDYRKLNQVTIDDKFPIPNIDDIFDKLGRAMYFTTLDLAKGFHQVEIDEEDIKKTAFSTDRGHYEFTRMPFGLKNAPATFQRLMNSVLAEFLGNSCLVYLDDIIIFSTSLEEHILSIRKIFERLQTVNLKIQLDKSEFLKKETEFLGHIVTTEGIKPNPNKIETILKYKIPKTTKEIKSFLGITGYYRKFIKDYSKIAKPMTIYLKKGSKINEKDPDYIKSFEDLKTLITSDPILIFPDFNKKFILTTDASNYAIGAVLSQEGHPISFASRTLNDHETNYSTIEKELLAIVWAVKYFRPYLYGRKFSIKTDHRPLVWLGSLKEPNSKLQRWKIKLEEFNYDIEYVKGKDNVVADGLSRFQIHLNELENSELNDCSEESQNDAISTGATIHSANEDSTNYIPIVYTPVNVFKTQIIIRKNDKHNNILHYNPFNKMKRTVIEVKEFNENDVIEFIKKYIPTKGTAVIYSNDDHLFAQFQDVYVKYFSKNKLLKLVKSSKFLIDIEDEEKALEKIIEIHNSLNHRGINESYFEMKEKYYFPNIKEKMRKFINNCNICNTSKCERNPYKPEYKLTETSKKPNDILHIDIWIGNRQSMYLTVIDKFTKHVTMHKLRSRSWIDLLGAMKNRIATMGTPKKIVIDGEPGFTVVKLKEYFKENNIEVHTTTAQKHTGNSDIERYHATLNEHIRILKAKDETKNNDLNDLVILALSFYNKTIHSTTGKRPLDFINGNIKLDEFEEIFNKIQNSKIKRIEKSNKNREKVDLKDKDHLYIKSRNVISKEYKLLPRYKKLDSKIATEDHYIDKKGIKYYKDQVKRKYKYENCNPSGNNNIDIDNNSMPCTKAGNSKS